MDEAAGAFIRGDFRTYLALLEHSDDYTLMPPGGGPTIHGFDGTPEDIDATSAFFGGPGEATWVTEATYVSGDMVVLVGVERQSGVIDGRERQDWSLRLTLVSDVTPTAGRSSTATQTLSCTQYRSTTSQNSPAASTADLRSRN